MIWIMMKKPGKFKSLLQNLIFMAVVVLVMLAFIEIFIRILPYLLQPKTGENYFCTGTWIRTKINGFGDRYSAIELCP